MSDRMSGNSLPSSLPFLKLAAALPLFVLVWVLATGCAGVRGSATAVAAPAVSPSPAPNASPSPTPAASPSPSPTPNPNATTFVYATDAGSLLSNDSVGQLFIMNTRDGSTTQINVPGGPRGLAVTPDASRIYIVQGDASSVAVIDSGSNQLIATIPVGHAPERVAISPNGRFAYVTNFQDGTVSVIDTAMNAVVNTIFTDSVPWAVAFSSDGRWAYVTLFDEVGFFGGPHHENALVVIDITTQSICKKIPLLTGNSMAASPTRHELYTVGSAFGLAIVDTETNELAGQVPLDSGQQEAVAVSPDGQTIYVVELGNVDIGHEDPRMDAPATVYVISAEQRAVIATAHTEPGLVSIGLSPDGSTAYLLENDISLPGMKTMDTKTLTFGPLIPMADTPIQLTVGTH